MNDTRLSSFVIENQEVDRSANLLAKQVHSQKNTLTLTAKKYNYIG
jgi:hypothetical protein